MSTMPKTHRPEKQAAGRTDWARVKSFTDSDIERMAVNDKDNPATTEKDWVDAVVGPPPLKTPVNAQIDRDVLEWFKLQGRGYQTHMNAVLRSYMQSKTKAV
jgi:uncharacterized protein (DUF4415 family)